MVGGQLVIPVSTESSGTLTACHTRGVFRLPKVANVAMVIGYWVIWDVSAGKVVYDKTAADDFNLGRVRKAAGSSDAYVEVIVDNKTRRVTNVELALTDVAAVSVSAVKAAPFAGRITKTWSQLLGGATNGDAVLTPKIGSTAITGGALTVTASGSAAGDIDYAFPTALNIVAFGDSLVFSSDGGGSTTRAMNCYMEIEEL
jgi:predicted RecA/RadA family phage recombinase